MAGIFCPPARGTTPAAGFGGCPGAGNWRSCFSMSPTVLKSQEFLSVYPRYVSADGKNGLELTPLYFSGRRRYKVIRRRRVLHREEKFYPPVENVRSSRDLEREVVLTARFPFEAWMADGHLEVVEKRAGCAECGSGGFAGRVLEATLPFFRPEDYRYSFVKPKQVPLKMIFDCNVLFPWDRDELMDDFEANGPGNCRYCRILSMNR